MPRDYKQQLDDILQAITFIREYVKGMDYNAFEADRKTQDAVIRNLEIIGEAARAVPDEIRDKASEIEWYKIIALRNILIHEYFGVNLKIVWDVIKNKARCSGKCLPGTALILRSIVLISTRQAILARNEVIYRSLTRDRSESGKLSEKNVPQLIELLKQFV